MNDREAQLARLHKLLSHRAQAWQTLNDLKKRIVPAEQQFATLERDVNLLIQALYPSTLPALPQEHEGRAFRNEDGELVPIAPGNGGFAPVPTQVNPAVPMQVNKEPLPAPPAEKLPSPPEDAPFGNAGLEHSTCKHCGVTIYKSPSGVWYHHTGHGFCNGESGQKAEPGGIKDLDSIDLFDKYTLDQLKEMYNQKSKALKDGKPWIKTVWDSAPALLNMPPSNIDSYHSLSVHDPAGEEQVYTVKLEYEDGFVAIRTANPNGKYYLSFHQKNPKTGHLTKIKMPPHNYNYLDENGQPLLTGESVSGSYGVKAAIAQAEAEKAQYQPNKPFLIGEYADYTTKPSPFPVADYQDFVGISDNMTAGGMTAGDAMKAAKTWLYDPANLDSEKID